MMSQKKTNRAKLFLFSLIYVFSNAMAHADFISAMDVGVDREGNVLSFQPGAIQPRLSGAESLDSDSFHGALEDGVSLLDDSSRSVQGTDERTRIFDTTSYPNRTIGRIDIGCTGTLIGPKIVLTAGHCVFDLKTKKWNTNMTFSPGQNENSKPYGTVNVVRSISTKAYTEEGKTEWDFAVLILAEPIGNKVGWMAYAYDESLKSLSVNINGYPGDKPYGTMWHSFCGTKDVKTELLTYLCDTYKGNSGSAVYQYNAQKGERKIFGIHTTGTSAQNHATRITKVKFEKLEKWKNENP